MKKVIDRNELFQRYLVAKWPGCVATIGATFIEVVNCQKQGFYEFK